MKLSPIILTVVLGCFSLMVSCTPAQRFYKEQAAVPQKPWDGASKKWGGYQQKTLSKGSKEISFVGYNKPDQSGCAYFCKVRAAETSLLDGHSFFYSNGVKTTTQLEESNFPMVVIPGYWESRPHVDYYRDSNGRTRGVTHYHRVWIPTRRFPPRTAINKINRATMQINYAGKGKKYNAREILRGAQTNKQKLGKVKLDPRVVNRLKGE